MVKRIYRKVFGKRNFESDKALLEKLINQNRLLFNTEKTIKKKVNKEICYIVNWHQNQLATIVPQLLFAQGLKKDKDMKIVVMSPKVDRDWKDFNKSFGATQLVVRRGLPHIIRAFLMSIDLILKRTSGYELLEFCYRGIPIGECLYDNIIRITPGKYTIETLEWRDFFKLVNNLSYVSCVYNLFERKRPTYYLPFERCHIEGAWTKMAAYFGAQIIQCTANGRVHYLGTGANVVVRMHEIREAMLKKKLEHCVNTDYKSMAYQYIEERFKGHGDMAVVRAYASKEKISKKEYIEKYKIDGNKKNIVVVLHAFSDEPHKSEWLLYRDYYEWYIETLKIIADIKTVNWIIKAHPNRKKYGEEQEVFDIYEQYKTENIFWFPEEYSTESLLEIADAIVTVQGTAGLEFSCLGKPIVVAGKACYSGWGYTIEPKTRKEYRDVLENMYKIEPLTEEQIDMACRILYCYNLIDYKPIDQFDEFLVESLKRNIYEGNNEVINKLYQNVERNKNYYIESKFYQIGVSMSKEFKHLDVGVNYENII